MTGAGWFAQISSTKCLVLLCEVHHSSLAGRNFVIISWDDHGENDASPSFFVWHGAVLSIHLQKRVGNILSGRNQTQRDIYVMGVGFSEAGTRAEVTKALEGKNGGLLFEGDSVWDDATQLEWFICVVGTLQQ